jgi:hypothetical protein
MMLASAAQEGGGVRSHESFRLSVTEQCDAAVNLQFFVAAVQMHLDSALADRQLIGDFFIAETTGCEANDFELTWRYWPVHKDLNLAGP